MRAVCSGAMRRRVLAVALACCLGSLACGRAEEDPEITRARQANELSRDLMSPFCPGRTLADCSSPDAAAVRVEIREALRAGEQPDQVRARIEARFGDHVVGVPRQALGLAAPHPGAARRSRRPDLGAAPGAAHASPGGRPLSPSSKPAWRAELEAAR